MSGLRAEYDKAHWESLPELKKVEMLKNWVVVEVDQRRVKGIVLSKQALQTLEKHDSTSKDELNKRNVKIYILGEKAITDQDLYETPEEKKPSHPKGELSPQEIARQTGKELREIRKEDYDSLNVSQKAANASFVQYLYLFKGTNLFIPESTAIITAYFADIKLRQEARARRRETPPLNQVLASVLGKKKRGKEA